MQRFLQISVLVHNPAIRQLPQKLMEHIFLQQFGDDLCFMFKRTRSTGMFTLMLLSFLGVGCGKNDPLPTVDKVDLNRYAGTWYEIARLPNTFEEGLKCVTATYTLLDDGRVGVTNKGVNESTGELDVAEGKARVPDDDFPGQLRVVFFWPFGGDYYIIDLDQDYRYALVGAPDRNYLWILGRDKALDSEILARLVDKAKELGFPTEQLIYPLHDCQG